MAASTTGRRKRRDGGSGCEGTEEGKTEWWFRWLQRTPVVKKLDGGRRARRPRRWKLNGGDRESSVFLLSLWRRRFGPCSGRRHVHHDLIRVQNLPHFVVLLSLAVAAVECHSGTLRQCLRRPISVLPPPNLVADKPSVVEFRDLKSKFTNSIFDFSPTAINIFS
ncbi:hypothetical protein PIB30_102050 [Stylosanthes scabra]|uniref:Uncharacterized protein n=1 Tax=Stylosanthes scabra TaxID=79078 RepID=A0ABU6UWI6_9FABA|nr:hypothetical protein [Stylosanthes scabra]